MTIPTSGRWPPRPICVKRDVTSCSGGSTCQPVPAKVVTSSVGQVGQRQLGDAVDTFINQRNISPFRETQAPDFLDMLSTRRDLVGAIAQFERALILVRDGAPGAFVIPWTIDPHPVLYNLAKQRPVDEHSAAGEWRIVVSQMEPGLFRIERLG